ncbi:TetR/AcrR family transcriptional regulator [Paractinoplanes globisporus]|uniref:TetR/AcrR family transcriptional regulator C-terminal domain-containing protein n=1 Tax=Paractinoplanes globisporus TaxID=113565 RepID=A0ABW6WAW9_9ACTN|nr:TetR/AcrR family transcriptional regulator [Actinoplanes globisporus]
MAETRRKPGPRRALTEREIVDAALALLDAGGAEAASIRRIAAAVGVAPNAVYTYFPDKAAVERALVERILEDVQAPAEGDWRPAVEALAIGLRSRLVAHPGAVPLMLGGPMDGPHALRLGELLLDLLAASGLDAASAARASYTLMVYVLGAAALEVADGPPGPLPPEAERIAARHAALGEVPAQAFPRTAAATGVMATWVGTEQFLWGLRRVLDGLEAAAK